MARYRYYDDYDMYPSYVSVGEKQARNRKGAEKLRKKNADIQPVIVDGRSIATSWWGKSWNANLERYADYRNRIGRGRDYVRHGAVLDLRIVAGKVSALVQGSRSKPYEVTVTIAKLPDPVWDRLRETAITQLDSLTELLAGKFPKALKDAFFAQGTGLFPAPKEIDFDCSCPDWASMCKHVAAVLYGIGNRLDAAPELLFTLRGVTVDDLIARTVDATAAGLVAKAERATGEDVLADSDLGDVFGIELDDGDMGVVDPPSSTSDSRKTTKRAGKPTAGRSGRKRTSRRTTSSATAKSKSSARSKTRKSANSAKTKPAKRTRNKAKASKPEPGRMIEQLVAALGRSRARFTTADLTEKLPGWTRSQVTNTLQRAIEQDRVKRVERGVYRRV